MKRSLAGLMAVAATAALLAHAPSASAEPMQGGKAFSKLGRGAVNLFTGWVEIPKRVHETSQASGAWAGFTWGLLRGLGHGFIRTAAGAYEIVSFPFPAPPGYVSVIQPEYVFSESAASGTSY
jgi:putative exosortase-associated protein (TIGR04073 family)